MVLSVSAENATVFQAVEPRGYFEQNQASGRGRADGRKYDGSRAVECLHDPLSSCATSVMVSWGSTKVICGVTAEVAAPLMDSPDSGFVVTNVEVSPMSSFSARSGPPSELSQAIAHSIQDLFSLDNPNVSVIDLKQLCIAPGEAVWCLHVDVLVLSDDGAIADAALLAAVCCIRRIELSQIVLKDGMVKEDPTGEKKKLCLRYLPLSLSVCIVNGADFVVLVDPTFSESSIADSRLSLTFFVDQEKLGCASRVNPTPFLEFLTSGKSAAKSAPTEGLQKEDVQLFKVDFTPVTNNSVSLEPELLADLVAKLSLEVFKLYTTAL